MTARVISGKYGFSYMLKYNPERLALNPILPSAKGQMTWQWLVYIWLWGKRGRNGRQAGLRLFLRKSFYFFFFFFCPWSHILQLSCTHAHTQSQTQTEKTPHLGMLLWSEMVRAMSDLCKIADRRIWAPCWLIGRLSSSSFWCEAASSQVRAGACLFEGAVIIFRNTARTDDEGGGCPDQKPKGSLSLSYLSLLLTAITGLHPQL